MSDRLVREISALRLKYSAILLKGQVCRLFHVLNLWLIVFFAIKIEIEWFNCSQIVLKRSENIEYVRTIKFKYYIPSMT